MNNEKQELQQVLVEVPKYDKEGNPIPPDSLSSGGARNAAGQIIWLYQNPRSLEPVKKPEIDRQLNELLSREHDAKRRHVEAAQERHRKEYLEFATHLLVDRFVKPLVDDVIVPQATKLLQTKVLPAGKRLTQRCFRPTKSQSEVPHENGETSNFSAETANPVATSQRYIDHTTEVSPLQKGDDTQLAEVIQMEKYQNRRSA